jgi:amino acid transporter
MKSDNQAANSESNASTWLKSLLKIVQFILGIICVSSAAYFIPLLTLAVVAKWTCILLEWPLTIVSIVFLCILNIIGNKIDKTLLVGIVAIVIMDVYSIILTLAKGAGGGIMGFLLNLIFYDSVFILNSWLWIKYKEITNL